jgi:PAS domain S-box-containing protein
VNRQTLIASIGRSLCVGGAALGALGFLGWIWKMPLLFTALPGRPGMMPNTAVALILIGTIGAVLDGGTAVPRGRIFLSIVTALPVLVIGIGTLAEYRLDTVLSIDQIILHSDLGPYPGRPSQPTALGISLVGLGILVFDFRPAGRTRPSEWMFISAALVALVGLAGQILGRGAIWRLPGVPVAGMSAPSAVSLLLSSVGLLMHRPNAGLMADVTSAAPGGVMFRRLTALAVVLPTLLGFVLTRLFVVMRVEELPLVVATVAIATTALTMIVLMITARLLNRTHAALEASQARTRDLIEHASDGILISEHARYTEVNGAMARMLGVSEEEILGRTAEDFIAPDEAERMNAWRTDLREGRSPITRWHLRHRNGTYIPVEASATILPDGRWEAVVRDVSERKAAEEVAERAQARIEGIISTAGDAIISIDAERRITLFNQGAEHVFGWTRDEAVGRAIDVLIPERFREAVSAGQAGRQSAPIYGLRKDGTEFPADASISRLSIGGEVTFTVVMHDLTARVRLEQELRDARGFLENVLQSITDYSLVALDLERRILFWNEGARRIFGYTSQEMVGASADVLHRPDDFASGVAPSLYARALDQGSAEAVMYRRRKDGSHFLARMVVSRRSDHDGKPTGYLLISRDVTREERRAEQDRLLAAIGPLLTSSLERSQVINAAAELLVHDFADVCIVALVDETHSGLGITSSRVVHRDARQKPVAVALESIHVDPRRTHLAAAALQTRQTTLVAYVAPEYLDSVAQTEEQRRLLHDLAPVSLISLPLEAHATLLGALTVISTDPKRHYEEADASFVEQIAMRLALSLDNARLFESSTKALTARDEVLRVVAHDLRNPLGTIRMQASLMSMDEGNAEHDGRKGGEVIARAANRMNHLIQDLLDVARLEAGHLSVKQAGVSARTLIVDALDAQQGLAANASLKLRAELPEHLPDVWADRDRMLQVFENLIGNATRHTKPGGGIIAGASPHDHEVMFWVKDTGEGISADDLPHIFERFWQRRKEEGGGAGLGLPIVKGLIESQGGRVWVESAPGTGSTFFFTVPVARASDGQAAPGQNGARGREIVRS